jgi:hypothetical protein
LEKELETREAVLNRTPITAKDRTYIEATVQAQKDKLIQIKNYLFFASVNANRSILGSINTFANMKNVATTNAAKNEELPPPPPPKMPGIYGGSKLERSKQPESQKDNLTPVDEEFYATDLGRKLE